VCEWPAGSGWRYPGFSQSAPPVLTMKAQGSRGQSHHGPPSTCSVLTRFVPPAEAGLHPALELNQDHAPAPKPKTSPPSARDLIALAGARKWAVVGLSEWGPPLYRHTPLLCSDEGHPPAPACPRLSRDALGPSITRPSLAASMPPKPTAAWLLSAFLVASEGPADLDRRFFSSGELLTCPAWAVCPADRIVALAWQITSRAKSWGNWRWKLWGDPWWSDNWLDLEAAWKELRAAAP